MGPVYAQRVPPDDAQAAALAVEQLLCRLPAASRLGPETQVLLKPNLLGRHKPEEAVTTHPDVLRAVLLALRRRGVRRVTLADSPAGVVSQGVMETLYRVTGVQALCAEFPELTLYTGCEGVPVAGQGRLIPQWLLLPPVQQADFIINLPKFKTHALTGMTGAVKNLFGCVPGLHKAEFHMRFPQRALFGQMLVELCTCVQADIHLVDALWGMEGNGPSGGTPVQVGRLLAGEDPHAMDLAICHLMGLDPARVPTLVAAQEAGLCGPAADPAALLGDAGAWQPLAGFSTPASYVQRVDFSHRMPGPLQALMPWVTRMASPKPAVMRQKCIGCGKCADICPRQVITVSGGKAHIALKNCIHCFCCHEVCPVRAIRIRQNPLFRL